MTLDQSTTSLIVSLLTLTMLEIVLGIDNIVFISLLSNKVVADARARARTVGLSLALITRILLLTTIKFIIGLDKPFVTLGPYALSFKALVLLGGGIFLIYKSVVEIYDKIDLHEEPEVTGSSSKFWSVVVQILLIDIVFSLDSVVTAVGMASDLRVMIAAVVIALAIMLVFSHWVAEFIEQHPSVKILALSFLLLIGANLVGEAAHSMKLIAQEPDKGFTYFAMAFAAATEFINIRVRKKKKKLAELKAAQTTSAEMAVTTEQPQHGPQK